MGAAEQLWASASRFPGQSLSCCALSDPEDNFVTTPPPERRPRTMSDQDEFRAAVTTPAPDTERGDRDTQPPDPATEERANAFQRDALRAPPLPVASDADSVLLTAIRDFSAGLVEMRNARREIATGFRVHGDKFDEFAKEHAANYALLAGEFRAFRDTSEARDNQQDVRINRIEKQLLELKEELIALVARATEDAAKKIHQLENELSELKRNGAPRSSSPAATG